MQRVFTKDVLKEDGTPRWSKGEISSDYPPMTWQKIAEEFGEPLDAFTQPLQAGGFIDPTGTPPQTPAEIRDKPKAGGKTKRAA